MFRLIPASGHNNYAYTAVDADGHAIATIFKVGPPNQDADAGKGAYRVRLSIAGSMNGKRFFVDSHDAISEKLKEVLSDS
ncbi:hypothetical protein [Serratia proteamaculans]|uniref:hypothetical protein n=1 Tax=Serratia proteamaculans TaxID=28151 RepID=UPI0021BD8C51|nr:hypothetical protein [Serratia proteamaculans]